MGRDQPNDRPVYAPGEQPYDRLNGLRIGAIAGGIVGGVAAALVGAGFAFLILIGAGLGSFAGGWWARRARPARPNREG